MSDFLDYLKKNLNAAPKAVLYNKTELLTSKKEIQQTESVKLNTKTEVVPKKATSEYNIASMLLEMVPSDITKYTPSSINFGSTGGQTALSNGQVVDMQVSKKDTNIANQLLSSIDF
jgi:hypothetical protein